MYTLTYYIYETLRISPPLEQSVLMTFLENVQIGHVHVLKGDPCLVSFYTLHHNPKEWQRPEEFLPERFDPMNPLSLAPSGKKRSPHSFCPFFGGRRTCLGKTVAELLAKVTLSMTTWNYELEFWDKEFYEKKPLFAFRMEDFVPMLIKINKRKLE
mmetsp:Transcript_26457/g.19834  ORF Transcript_26457/g.19834 Transcript_26457/m.19834 type:complete len:156 (-) Transcript_26457:62-529(-)